MFKVYKASAGAGKTTHLVAEFLAICFTGLKEYRKILAVTFTNNATAEMKDRIIRTLHKLAFEPDYNQLDGSTKAIIEMLNDKKTTFSCRQGDKERLREQAILLLRNILYDYEHLSISTIDSFFQKLVRAFAFELGIHSHYNIEISKQDIYKQTIDILLNKISKTASKQDKGISDEVLKIMERNLEEKGKSMVERELYLKLQMLDSEDSYLPFHTLQAADKEKLQENIQELIQDYNQAKETLLHWVQQGQDLILKNGYESSDFYQGNRGMFSFFDKLLENPNFLPNSYHEKCLENETVSSKKSRIHFEDDQKFLQLLRNIKKIHPVFKEKYIIQQNLQNMVLLFDLFQIMNELKEENNIFFVSDSTPLINQYIKDEDSPYIYEKIGNRYIYYLIDEFQDTSKMQWENFLPLIRNTVSSGGDAILFGDVKQAIYRFRNGDSELLQALSSKEGFEKSMGRNSNEKEYEMLNLDCNYRSSEEVINYNNQYFSKLIEPGGDFEVAQAYYADVVQNKPPTKTSERTGFIVEKNRQSEEDRTIFFEREIVEAVEDAIKTGHQAKDIAILTRGRASGSEYARLLTKKGYAVISSDSLLLNSSIEVRTLIAALQLLLNPKHPIAALQLELYKKAKGNNEQNTSLTTDKTVKDEKAKDLLEKPLYSMVRSLLSVLKMNINERFMIAFLDEVLKFSQKGSGSLSDFLDWWQEKKDSLSLTLPKETDAITITTIHKAKGLEYPIVILPLKSLSNRSSKTEFWYKNTDKTTEISWVPISINKELEGTRFDIIYQEEKQRQVIDNINIIYVAMTRAREGMYLLRG